MKFDVARLFIAPCALYLAGICAIGFLLAFYELLHSGPSLLPCVCGILCGCAALWLIEWTFGRGRTSAERDRR